MIALIKFLFFGHIHKWKTIHSERLSATTRWAAEDAKPYRIFTRYTQQCEECGKLQHYDAG
jgi:hypothetical protein